MAFKSPGHPFFQNHVCVCIRARILATEEPSIIRERIAASLHHHCSPWEKKERVLRAVCRSRIWLPAHAVQFWNSEVLLRGVGCLGPGKKWSNYTKHWLMELNKGRYSHSRETFFYFSCASTSTPSFFSEFSSRPFSETRNLSGVRLFNQLFQSQLGTLIRKGIQSVKELLNFENSPW